MNKLFVAAMLLVSISVVSCSNTRQSAKQEKVVDSLKPSPGAAKLEEVFADSVYQITGVSISPDNRLFVNYPYWLEKHSYAVLEVGKDGKGRPFPDESWNNFKKGEDGANKFVCVQAVFADEKGFLWVVDPAGIGLSDVYQKSNKVVLINLKTNKVERIYRFPENVAGPKSYLNDIRVDNKNGFAYMTSSSNGAIVVLNTKTGASRMVLNKHYSTLSDSTYHFKMNGREFSNSNGVAKINADGIAISPDKELLYYKSLTDNRLFRISTAVLRDFNTSEDDVKQQVEDLGRWVTSDGMEMDQDGNLYLGDLEHASIVKISPDKKITTLVQDRDKLSWPDSYSISKDGYLYISCSQIQQMPWFNGDENLTRLPYKVFRIKIK